MLQVPSSYPVPVFLVLPQVDAPSSGNLVPGQFPAMLRAYELTLDTISCNNNEKNKKRKKERIRKGTMTLRQKCTIHFSGFI